AVAAGFLFRSESLSYQQGLFYLGIVVSIAAFATLLVRFSPQVLAEEDAAYREAADSRAAPAELSLR
ncbi:MAG: MFS transporter, partial [Halomonas sp.]|nr:MFS transporter [Halomonas sp.]